MSESSPPGCGYLLFVWWLGPLGVHKFMEKKYSQGFLSIGVSIGALLLGGLLAVWTRNGDLFMSRQRFGMFTF